MTNVGQSRGNLLELVPNWRCPTNQGGSSGLPFNHFELRPSLEIRISSIGLSLFLPDCQFQADNPNRSLGLVFGHFLGLATVEDDNFVPPVADVGDGELVLDPSTVPTFFLGYDRGDIPEGMWRTGDQVRREPQHLR